jgi:hypothetical protein
MILYELVCDHGHSFESWFRDSAAYDVLAGAGGLSCPVCASSQVSKALMAPRLARRKGHDDRQQQSANPDIGAAESTGTAKSLSRPASASPAPSKLGDVNQAVEVISEFLEHVRNHVESTCDYVGDQFAEEARRIHYGESDARGIYGEASVEDTKALHEEGVEILPLPIRRTTS